MMGFGLFLTIFMVFSLTDCALDFQCLKCLCETATQCTSLPCDRVKCRKIELNNFDCACGPFGITPGLWMTANKPVLDDKAASEAEKFRKCVETFPCSIWAVQYYMEKYAEDCDNDNLINCDDYVLLHVFGPNNCRNASLNEQQLGRYKTCMSRTEIIQPGSSGRTTTKPTTTTSTPEPTENTSSQDENFTEESSTIQPIEEKVDNKNFELTDGAYD